MVKLEVYFDGGRGGTPRVAYGSFDVLYAGASILSARRIVFGDNTSNEAEYMSLIAALKHLGSGGTFGGIGVAADGLHVSVFSDSMLVVQQLKGRWKIKHPNMIPLHAAASLILGKFGSWEISWQSRKYNVARFGH